MLEETEKDPNYMPPDSFFELMVRVDEPRPIAEARLKTIAQENQRASAQIRDSAEPHRRLKKKAAPLGTASFKQAHQRSGGRASITAQPDSLANKLHVE